MVLALKAVFQEQKVQMLCVGDVVNGQEEECWVRLPSAQQFAEIHCRSYFAVDSFCLGEFLAIKEEQLNKLGVVAVSVTAHADHPLRQS